jgi:hypothetical protein
MDRAFSTIALKSLDEEQREFRGLATSPVPDRVLDIIEPLGAKYRNPTVLLRAHAHDAPIGEVFFDRPTKTGIGFRARIPKIQEPGLLKDRVDMAWGEIKHGLVRAVSVGFRPLEVEPLKSGGVRFIKSEIYELSTVAVPAQELATIDHVKAIDAAIREGRSPVTIDNSASDNSGALWRRIGLVGLAAMDEFQRSDEAKQLGPLHGVQVASTRSLQSMVKELCRHVESLERRQAESPLQYRGVWKADHTFPANSFVTFNGCVWHTEKATDRKPGEGDWVMAVKRGRDGKDAGR